MSAPPSPAEPALRADPPPRIRRRARPRRRPDGTGVSQGRRSLADYGLMYATTGRLPDLTRRRRCSFIRAIAAASTLLGIWPATPDSFQADAYAGFGDLYDGKRAQTRPDHRGGLLEPWSTPLLRARRSPRSCAAGSPGGSAHRRDLCHRAPDQRSGGRRPTGGASAGEQADCRRPRKMDAHRTSPAVAPRRDRQSDRLHADTLASLYPFPRRQPHLPHQQRLPNARYEVLLWYCRVGSSPAPTAAASERPRCTG